MGVQENLICWGFNCKPTQLLWFIRWVSDFDSQLMLSIWNLEPFHIGLCRKLPDSLFPNSQAPVVLSSLIPMLPMPIPLLGVILHLSAVPYWVVSELSLSCARPSVFFDGHFASSTNKYKSWFPHPISCFCLNHCLKCRVTNWDRAKHTDVMGEIFPLPKWLQLLVLGQSKKPENLIWVSHVGDMGPCSLVILQNFPMLISRKLHQEWSVGSWTCIPKG